MAPDAADPGPPSAPEPLAAERTAAESIAQRFEQAARLAQRRKLDQALPLFESCLALAADARLPLPLDQLAGILLEIAFCHGDAGRWDAAFELYDAIEALLSGASAWRASLPWPLATSLPAGFAPEPLLAALAESRGIAYDNAGRPEAAQASYRRAVELYLRLGNVPKAATAWHHVAIGCQRRADWPGLERAAEQMLRLWGQVEGLYGQIWAWQYLAQAHSARGDLRRAVDFMAQAVAAERSCAHRDLPRDEQLLAELRQAYARTLPGRVAALRQRLSRRNST